MHTHVRARWASLRSSSLYLHGIYTAGRLYAGLAAAFASPAFASGYGAGAAHCQNCQQSGALLPPVFGASPLATLATLQVQA